MALCARNTFFSLSLFFPPTTVFLAGTHAVCPFGMADWLNRLRAFIIYTVFLIKKKKCKSVRFGLANGTKRTPSQNRGNLLSELHVPHRQCFAGISNAFSASFTSIWPSFPRFYCTPNKACLLCATPAGNYRVQSPGFPKIVYYSWDVSKAVAKSWQRKIPQPEGHMVPTALIFVCIVL